MRWLRTGHLDGGDHPSLAVVVEEGEVVDLPPGAAVGEEVVGRGEDEAEGPRPRLGDEVWTAARQTDGRGALPMEREGRTGGQDRENDRETAPGGKQAYQGSRHATATKQEAYPGGRCPPPVTRAAKCPRMRCFATGPFACGLAQGPDYGLRPHRAGARSAATQGGGPGATAAREALTSAPAREGRGSSVPTRLRESRRFGRSRARDPSRGGRGVGTRPACTGTLRQRGADHAIRERGPATRW